jgi:hypothetical protein
MITIEDFQVAVSSLLQLLPMQRALDPAALLLAWDTFPERAKIDLTDEILLYAVQQRVLDPEPPKGMAPHVALLRYAYPVDRTIRRGGYGPILPGAWRHPIGSTTQPPHGRSRHHHSSRAFQPGQPSGTRTT